jgi:hypothetical protein
MQQWGGVVVFDQNLDGKPDILSVAAQTNSAPLLLRNAFGGPPPYFTDITTSVGLSQTDPSSAFSAVAADFGGTGAYDGDLDLYVGHPSSGSHYFFQNRADNGLDGPVNRSVRVSVTAPGSGNNRMGLGARVLLEAPPTTPTLKQEQLFTGESTRGSISYQGDAYASTVTFGVGQYAGDVKITLFWPDGYVEPPRIQNDTVNPEFFFKNSHGPGLLDATAALIPYGQPSQLVDYEWHWEQSYGSDITRDKVVILNPLSGTACISPTTLTPTTPGVAYTVVPKPGGGYVHTLRWSGQPCIAPCKNRWYVQVSSGSTTETSTTRTFNMPVCIQ